MPTPTTQQEQKKSTVSKNKSANATVVDKKSKSERIREKSANSSFERVKVDFEDSLRRTQEDAKNIIGDAMNNNKEKNSQSRPAAKRSLTENTINSPKNPDKSNPRAATEVVEEEKENRTQSPVPVSTNNKNKLSRSNGSLDLNSLMSKNLKRNREESEKKDQEIINQSKELREQNHKIESLQDELEKIKNEKRYSSEELHDLIEETRNTAYKQAAENLGIQKDDIIKTKNMFIDRKEKETLDAVRTTVKIIGITKELAKKDPKWEDNKELMLGYVSFYMESSEEKRGHMHLAKENSELSSLMEAQSDSFEQSFAQKEKIITEKDEIIKDLKDRFSALEKRSSSFEKEKDSLVKEKDKAIDLLKAMEKQFKDLTTKFESNRDNVSKMIADNEKLKNGVTFKDEDFFFNSDEESSENESEAEIENKNGELFQQIVENN